MNWGYVIAIVLGIINTCMMNLAKGMQRHGIVIFDKKRNEKNEGTISDENKSKKPAIYIIGVVLNQLPFIWIMISNMFAPYTYFTSMYGVGLVLLLWYSHKFLKESLTKRKIIGAVILITGTIILGVDGIIRPELEMADINVISSSIFIGILIVLAGIFIPLAIKTKNAFVIGIVFGIIGGAFQSLDAVIKGIGQAYGAEKTGFFPSNAIGWIIFMTSFLSGTFSFLLSQIGFSKRTDASVQVPTTNSSFIVTPILIQLISLPGYNLTVLMIVGVVLVVSGIILMQMYPQNYVVKNSEMENINRDSA
jgi:hypothetical protein